MCLYHIQHISRGDILFVPLYWSTMQIECPNDMMRGFVERGATKSFSINLFELRHFPQ